MTQHWSGQTQASANAIEVQPQQDTQKQVQMYATTHTRREACPTIEVQVFSSTGTKISEYCQIHQSPTPAEAVADKQLMMPNTLQSLMLQKGITSAC